MSFSDTELSAFLDGELTAVQMEQVRNALAQDEALADRLAELASVDAQVRTQASAIDAQPLPEAIWEMLRPQRAKNVIGLPVRPRQAWNQGWYLRAASASGVALLMGLVAGHWWSSPDAVDPTARLATYLDQIPSGNPVVFGAGQEFESRFSFIDRQQRFCRQYRLQEADQISENLACREGSDWKLIATAMVSQIAAPDEFQTASSDRLLESAVYHLMPGSALALSEEATWLDLP